MGNLKKKVLLTNLVSLLPGKIIEFERQLDAQRQYMVIGTLALLLIFLFFVIFCVSRAAAPEGTGGDGVLTSIF